MVGREAGSSVRWWCAVALLAQRVAGAKPCDCGALAELVGGSSPRRAERERVAVPSSFLSRNLSSQVVLLKVPETGSSTAANLLAELARSRRMPSWVSTHAGEFEHVISEPPRSAPKWALGHRGWGPWLHDYFDGPLVDLITTARSPMARLASSAEKRLLRGEAADCARGLPVALKFWGVDAKRGLDAARQMAKFDTVVLTERYNESLVAFAARHRLQLGDVLPPLAKLPSRFSITGRDGSLAPSLFGPNGDRERDTCLTGAAPRPSTTARARIRRPADRRRRQK